MPIYLSDLVTQSNTIGSADLQEASVTSDKITANAVTHEKIAHNTITAVNMHTSFNTDALPEGSANLYYTDAKVYANILNVTTDAISEGSTNEYFTDAKVYANILNTNADAITEGSTNQYFTNARAVSAFSAGENIVLDSNGLVTGTTVTTYQNLSMSVAISDETTTQSNANAAITFRAPCEMFLYKIPRASLTNASSSGAVVLDINEGGTSILSTKLSIDQGNTTSTTSGTQAVLSDNTIADDAEITIDIDNAGNAATGIKVTFFYREA